MRKSAEKVYSSLNRFLASDKKGFFFLSLIATAASIVGMGVSYLFHFFMVRMLSQAQYGDLSTLIGIATVFTVPQLTLQGLIAREVAIAEKKKDEDLANFVFRKYAFKYALLGVILGVAGALISLLLFGGLSATGIAGVIMMLSLPLVYSGSAALGYFQGKENVWPVASYLVGNPLFRTGSAALLVFLGFGVIGAGASLVIGPLVLVPLLVYLFLTVHVAKTHSVSLRGALSFMVATNVIMTLIIYSDLFFVRFALGAVDAGIYNTASMTAKILFFAANALVIVLLPKASKLSFSSERGKVLLLLGKAAALMVPVAVVFLVFAEYIIQLFYTSAYAPAVLPFRILTIGMLFFAFNVFITNVFWSQKDEKTPLILNLVGAVILVPLLFALVPVWGLNGAALATTITSFLLAAASFLLLLRARSNTAQTLNA